MYTSRRVFDRRDQETFARLSSDYNPIHLDQVAARRTHAGCPIVHGIHALVWGLDCFARTNLYEQGAKGLRVQFLRPIYVDDEVVVEIARGPANGVKVRVTAGEEDVLTATIEYQSSGKTPLALQTAMLTGSVPPSSPVERRLELMEHLGGALRVDPVSFEIATIFPAAVQAFGMPSIASLVATSCLVGMVVPGLYSMYSGLDISFTDERDTDKHAIQFLVLSLTPRFRSLKIGVRGPGVGGTLEAISLLPPVKQASMEAVRSCVSVGEFQHSRALIIGGSRGLGELTAKLVAAGGGDVTITYASGADDARAVTTEIRDAGFRCSKSHYDAKKSASDQMATVGVVPTHLYYFATPHIFRRKSALFDYKQLAEFNLFYVAGFFAAVDACVQLAPQGICVFYPSSTAVESRPRAMTEYAMSKAAGEVLCEDMARFIPGAQIITHRLPRLPTDQTNSFVNSTAKDPIEILLPIIREMHTRC